MGKDFEGSTGSRFIPPAGTAMQVPARCWAGGGGAADANLRLCPRSTLIPAIQRQIHSQRRLRAISCKHRGLRETPMGPRGGEGEGTVPRLHPALGRPAPGELGDWSRSRGRGSGRRTARPDLLATPPPPAGPGSENSARVAALGGGHRPRTVTGPPGRAHTHPAPPWEPSASSTAAG